MVDRINLLLQAKNITSRQFAEEIGIQPSGMSHILSGRNNPSLDFVMKVIRRWPEININWLMFGKGEMFTSVVVNIPSPSPVPPQPVAAAPAPQPSAPVPQPSAPEPDLFSSLDSPAEPAAQPAPAPAPAQVSEKLPAAASAQQTPPVPAAEPRSIDPLPSQAEPKQVAETVPAPSPKPMEAAPSVQQPLLEAEPEPEYAFSAKPHENRVNDSAAAAAPVQPIPAKAKKIVKIVVLYDDHTFSEYRPE